MTYTNLTNEELVERISEGNEAAYEQLFRNLHPVILHEAAMYLGKMETYSLEDLIQECHITCWEVISRGNWTPETKEERSRRVMAYQKKYYAEHPDKLAERREKNRIRERERRAAKKAARLAAMAEAQATAATA